MAADGKFIGVISSSSLQRYNESDMLAVTVFMRVCCRPEFANVRILRS